MQAGQGSQSQWCHDFYVNLRVGDRGNDVSALQHALNLDLGQIVEETGYFGEDTASAVTGLQEKYRGEILTPNGLRNRLCRLVHKKKTQSAVRLRS